MSHYIHGTHREEQERLARLNEALNDACLAQLAPRPGERVLDVGSGLGQFTRRLGTAAGVPAVGIERSPEQLAEALRLAQEAGEQESAEFRKGDAMEFELADEWGTFDVAHARFILEHVPHPERVVERMVRAVRPGGRIVLMDDDHDLLRLWPDAPGFLQAYEAYSETYTRLGNDPRIGRKLPELLVNAGARPLRTSWIFYGAPHGHPRFEAMVENMVGLVTGARDSILGQGLLDELALDQGIEEMGAWRDQPHAALWFALPWAEGVKP